MMRRADHRTDAASIALAAVFAAACASASSAQPAEEGAWPPPDANVVEQGYMLTVEQQSALSMRLYRHWDAPCDAPRIEDLGVTVTFTLNPDGSLATLPRIEDAETIASSTNLFLHATAENARRAVVRAFEMDGPIDFLPAEHYEDWKSFKVNYLPALACGGVY